ncbi:aromatic ring-hydroxylating oxygenase subunit alpha [Athalassotoga saccharophila]|uniref:aromatic ring-hydroxylating oxygenase subunit alpha n=1 Tax=Athalassotoga saccharophila TaxID=1441386 RepID=UPI00137ACD09|nr:aromatic ring-hydroxylating dioxygenase subunit alpha [Athalassotoga saccharophila]BBJ28638.1 Toluene-4-sulfonate monooxygenase system iron-sulfur subunit TsaM1 [Athalassotoga saccharophila]
MIYNQWYIVLDSKEVKKEKITAVKRLGKDLLFWRDNSNQIHCVERRCAHRGADLALGKIVNDHVQCPFHGIEYDGSGRGVLIPSIGKNGMVRSNFKVKSYPVIEKGGFVFMWFGEEKDLPEIKWLEGIDETFNYSSLTDIWPVHYSRSIENQLDVSHLPFVHYNTIGRGGRTLVNGPIVEYKDGIINVWVNNVVDNGQKPLKPEEVKKEDCIGRLQFIFPNYWQNIINKDLRVVAAFVPIDDSNTIIYLRFYQRFLKVPLIRNLVTKISMPFNKKILNQDKRVVITQRPIKSELRMNENLYQGDLPIIIYRRVREELKKSSKEVSE